MKDRVFGYAKKILDYSITKQEAFSGDDPVRAWVYQYVFLNIVLARPSFSVVCTWERKQQLEKLGMNESGMISLIALQAIADHTAPNFVIAGIFAGIHQMTDIPPSISVPASWLLGRTAWGAMCGVAHASAYTLTKERSLAGEPIDSQLMSPTFNQNHFSETDYKFSPATF
jgi:hypothetical protein